MDLNKTKVLLLQAGALLRKWEKELGRDRDHPKENRQHLRDLAQEFENEAIRLTREQANEES